MAMAASILKKALAEMVGTYALVFFGCGYIVISNNGNSEFIPFVFGGIVMVMIYALGAISGGHFNPAVSVGFALSKRFPWQQVPHYIFAQFIGSLLACTTLWAVLDQTANYGMTSLSVSSSQGFMLEALLSFFLMLVIVSVATHAKAPKSMAGAAIGGTVGLCALLGGPLSGASMNPARSFGPAIFSGDTTHLWVFFVAPCIGTTVAAWFYTFLFCDPHGPEEPRVQVKGCC